MPIESTIFAYQAQQDNAARIVARVLAVLQKEGAGFVVVATPTDIAALAEDQAAVMQSQLLRDRLAVIADQLNNSQQGKHTGPYSCVAAAPPPPSHGPKAQEPLGPALAAAVPVLQTFLGTLGSALATTTTTSSASGDLADASLIAMVAGGLAGNSTEVFVPSVYAPRLFAMPKPLDTGALKTDQNVGDSGPLYTELGRLEIARQQLFQAADQYIAKKCLANATGNAPVISRIDQNVNVVSGIVDSFETAILSGLAVSGQGQPSSQQQGGSQTPPGGGASAPSNPGLTGVSSAIPVQELLMVDRLLAVLQRAQNGTQADAGQSPSPQSTPEAQKVYLLAVHALDSGGTTLTRSNSIFGSRTYFSGAVGASFELIDDGARWICGGDTYAYRGFVEAKDAPVAVGDVATPPAADHNAYHLPPVVRFTTTQCGVPVPSESNAPIP